MTKPRMTTLQINAIIGLAVISMITLGLGFMLVKNDLQTAHFFFIGGLMKDCVIAIVGITWYFAKRQEDPPLKEKEE